MSEIFEEGAGFNTGAFLTSAIEEGWSARQAISEFRAAGMSMGNETFRQMYAEARDIIANRDVIAGLDYNAIPPADAYSDWAAGEADRYATFVQSWVRMPGERELEPRFYQYVTDEPHTPGEALDAAMAHYTDDSLLVGGTPPGIFQGGVVTSMTRTVARV